MNETEKRRKLLLEQTRNLYQDDKFNPAVHPRYKASYDQLYLQEPSKDKGTFGIRCMVCIFIFVTYIMMGTNNRDFVGMNRMQVREKIMQNYTEGLY